MIINFALSVWCGSDEPDRYISHYTGEILTFDESEKDDGCGEPNIKAGAINFFHVDYGRIIDDYESLFEAMDSMSSETMECYEAIIDQESNEWKEEVAELIGEDAMIRYNILLINRLELNEQFRGKGIGKSAIKEVISRFGSTCAVIICKPFPLQYKGYGAPEHANEREAPGYEENRQAAFRKVAKFWEGVGFQKLSGSDYYIWSEEPVRRFRNH